MGSHVTRRPTPLPLIPLVLAVGLTASCKKTEEAPAEETPPAKAEEAAPPPTATPESGTADPGAPVHRRLLAWVDPAATAIAYTTLPSNLDVGSLATVFALPPTVEKLLRDALEVPQEMGAINALDNPPPSEWLAPQAVAMMPAVGLGTNAYVLRPTTRPRSEVEKFLADAGLEPTTVEGITVYEPRRTFPWKVAFLEDDILGFIPAKTLGAGLTPLTAGRDLPPSQTETELTKTLDAEPEALLELFAAGPILHLDLGRDVAGIRLAMRNWKNGGMDGAVVIQPVSEPATALNQLGARELSFETDAVQAIARRVAFTVSGPMIEGRLQMTADDVQNLEKGS